MFSIPLPLICTITAIIACLFPYLSQGYPLSDDSIHGLIRVKEYHYALANRQLPPYWAENLYGGFGSPIFLFYAPLYMFIAAIFYTLTGSIIAGSIGAIAFFSVAGALVIYILVQEILGEKSSINQCAARIAVYFFILNPYILGNKFIRVANAEYSALCLAPLALYGLVRIRKDPLNGGLILAAGLALVILAHNLTSLTIMTMLLGMAVVLYGKSSWKKTWPFIVGGITLGLLLSAFFWVPALYYKDLVQIERLTTDGMDFHRHFKPAWTFFSGSDNVSMGMLNLWVILVSLYIFFVFCIKERSENTKFIASCIVFVLLFLILQSRLSMPLWETIEYLSLFQFPWRMMGPLALILSVLAGLVFPIYCKKRNIISYFKLEIIILFLCIINALPLLTAKLSVSENLNTLLASAAAENNIKKIIFSTTEADEYLPKTAKIKLENYKAETRQLLVNQPSLISTKTISESGKNIVFKVNSKTQASLEIKRWYFPGLKCLNNRINCELSMSDNGLIRINTFTGENNIHLELLPPYLRKIFTKISLAALFLWLVFVAYKGFVA